MSKLEELYKIMKDEAPYGFHPTVKKYIIELAEIYAQECCKASLEEASKNITIICGSKTKYCKQCMGGGCEMPIVDKSTVVSLNNIILL